MTTRREFLQTALCGAAGLALAKPALAQSSALVADWRVWRANFVREGRVTDPGQNGMTTSEGQGCGMLLAVAAQDRAAFDALWQWTRDHLDVRGDGLFAWRWQPEQGVPDHNDAADSDILIAWALARAAQRFGQPTLLEAARRTARAIRTKLLIDTPWGTVLKPAVEGFSTPKGQVVNLSYWVFPAFPELAAIDPAPQWQALSASGLKLLSIARFGRWQLPPDWLLLVDPLVPDPTRPPRFGYEAVRIPLYLYWARVKDKSFYAPFEGFWRSFPCKGFLPAWTNLVDDSIDSFGAEPGLRAISTLVATGKPPRRPEVPLPRQGYYSATLWLLVRLAAEARS